ncbi:hemopexin repeat-containing protein [Streptomyces sp. NPDC023998]|uniref:hemopexin repeat-containing protein n=1 Tax=Streptomyces sp. NPDC023998 TaxID=3154597 RepID=UPI0034036E9A
MKDNFRASLRSEPRYRLGEAILIDFALTNVSDQDIALLTWNTPLETQDEVLSYFQVHYGDALVPYDGRFVKRGEPDERSYRLISAGATVVETVDLTTAYGITVPGTYTVTLDARIADAFTQDEDAPRSRRREDHQGFDFDPVSTTFEVVGDGEPRYTVAEKERSKLGGPQAPSASLVAAKLTAMAPVIVGGTAARQQEVRTAHENAGAFAEASMQQLVWTAGSANTLSAEWFGTHDAGRYATVKQHFTDISAVVAGQALTYDLTGAGCQPSWYAYTYKNTRKIWLCSNFWPAEATGTDSKFGVLVHELSHAVSSTDDLAYGQTGARNLAATTPADAIRNADNHEYFAETHADRVITAPVVWNNGKAYMFVAGKYYQYDIGNDKVDPGFPQPIKPNWPGLFPDRVDAGVVWPDGNAYFFRGSQYVRYDIAADKVPPGYPLPISPYWPGLWSDGIDAAVVWPDGNAYFFRGSQYVRYDIAADKVPPGYPLPISPYWPGLWPGGLTGGVVWPDGNAYFFRGSEYVRYEIATDTASAPKPVSPNWPGLP